MSTFLFWATTATLQSFSKNSKFCLKVVPSLYLHKFIVIFSLNQLLSSYLRQVSQEELKRQLQQSRSDWEVSTVTLLLKQLSVLGTTWYQESEIRIDKGYFSHVVKEARGNVILLYQDKKQFSCNIAIWLYYKTSIYIHVL